MSREHLLVLFGFLVVLAPFSGVPLSWLTVALPVIGVSVAVIGMTLVARKRRSAVSLHEEISETTAS